MRITDAVRRLAFATAVALVVLAAPAWATPAGSSGRIFEKELTSDTTCHVVSRAPDGTDPTQALASCPDFSFNRDGKVTAETAHEGTHGVDIIKNGQVVRTITVASRTSSQSYALAVLSPDGARVAFTLDESDAFNKTYSSLYVAPTDGSAGPRLLYGYNAMAGTGGVVRDWPAWTPDSHAIATFFYPTTSDASAFGNPHLATFDPATGTMTDRGASSALAPSDSTAWMVPFAVEDASPDGTRLLLFAERQDFNSTTSSTDTVDRLWEVNLADNTRVSNSEYSTVNRLVIGAAYSPDGTQLAIHDLNYDGTSPNQGDNLIIKQLHGTAQSVVPIRAGATTAQGTDVVWLAGAPDVVITQGPLGTVR